MHLDKTEALINEYVIKLDLNNMFIYSESSYDQSR